MRAVVAGAWNVFDAIAADRRTDVNAENPAGETPLMYLAIAGQTDRARALIARGAQSTAWAGRRCTMPRQGPAGDGATAAAAQGHGQRARAIGRNAADDGRAVGQQAHGRAAAQAGADVTTRDTKGQNAADWATTGKSTKLAAELRELIARQDRDKQARRAAAPTEIEAGGRGRGAAGHGARPSGQTAQPVPATDARAALAPTVQAQQPVAPGGAGAPAVRGVSGVQLNSYE